MKQEILLCHMGIINIVMPEYITPTVPHSSIFFSSFLFHHVVLVDWFLAILPPFVILPSFVMLPSFAALQSFAMLHPFAMLQPFTALWYKNLCKIT